jgi:alpha-mannosidase
MVDREQFQLPGGVNLLGALLLLTLLLPAASAHEVYLMNSNHTDYNWNATAVEYDAAMLSELDFHIDLIRGIPEGTPEAEQARYVPDNWWWLYLYETNRGAEEFQQLIDLMRSGHITVPLNPFVTLYGAMPTETVIRAGYYPGRIARQYGVDFRLAEAIENHTNPWGLASIWSGSGVEYTWKGVCNCARQAPHRNDEELFFWQGPDDKNLLFKWYNFPRATWYTRLRSRLYRLFNSGPNPYKRTNRDWGGYSEARDNLSSPEQIDFEINRTKDQQPGISVTGLFGAGWDDVSWENTRVIDAVVAYNAKNTGNRAFVSNGIDFFEKLEANGEAQLLKVLRGGWGNDWDMWPASLAEPTARTRRALERLRTAEMLSAYVQLYDETFWTPVRRNLEAGLYSVWKYFEHGWNVTEGGPTLAQMQSDKKKWSDDIETAVTDTVTKAETKLKALFSTPDEDRIAVFNPLGFDRTDFAQVKLQGAGPYVVTDVETDTQVPSQVYTRGATTYLRFLAVDVPSLGHRIYRYSERTTQPIENAAIVNASARTIENSHYRVALGERGQITEINDLRAGRQLVGSRGMNGYDRGVFVGAEAENVGPVSATLRVDTRDPVRAVRVTLYADIDRIEVENEIRENQSGTQSYSFHANLSDAQLHFEEIGAIARPGLKAEGGDFLQGTRANRMTFNHFANFGLSDYNLVLSNWDAYAMQVNDSTNEAFDLKGDTVHVIIMDWQQGAGTKDQAGDDFFINRFALRGIPAAFDGAESMRTALAHQNRLHAIALPRNQSGPIVEARKSLLSISADNVVVTALKPAEDKGAGFVVRAWELDGLSTDFSIDASSMEATAAWRTSLVETDQSSAGVDLGLISAFVKANEIVTYRFIVRTARRD